MLVNIVNTKKSAGTLAGTTAKSLFVSGGMPSSHTATVVALCGCVAFSEGLFSNLFSACCIFAFIVIFDALNVRRTVGDMTEKFNALAAEYCEKDGREFEKVKVVKGHNLAEVVAGGCVGVIISFLFERLPELI